MNGLSDGGPAFPSGPASGNWGVSYQGISLRDYFAAKAMVALIHKLGHPQTAAERAYEHADAMLKAREPK